MEVGCVKGVAQDRAIQVLDRACVKLPEGDALAALQEEMADKSSPIEQAWVCVLLDTAINHDLFIKVTKGESIVYGEGDTAVAIDHGEVFKSAAQIYDGIESPDAQAALWDAAEEALKSAAKSMRQ